MPYSILVCLSDFECHRALLIWGIVICGLEQSLNSSFHLLYMGSVT